MPAIVTRDEDSVNQDICNKNKWNWSWLEKKLNVDVKKVVLSMTCKEDPIISFCVGESIRKLNLHKQTPYEYKQWRTKQRHNKSTVTYIDDSCFCSKVRLNINLIIKSSYSLRNLALSIFEIQSKFVLIIWLIKA